MFKPTEKIIALARTGAENQQQELLYLLMDALALIDGEANVDEILGLLRENLDVLKQLDDFEL